MRLLLKFSLAALIGLTGYLFWPRSSSLSAFDAIAMAELHINLWRHAADREEIPTLFDLYGILNGQYRIPPIAASSAAVELLQARRAFTQAADQADEEKALPHLEKAFSIVGKKTGTNLDPAIIARLELFTWSLARDGSKERQLAEATSEKLALLHGGAAQDFQSTAAGFARAARLAATKNWSAANKAECTAWKKLSDLLETRSSNADNQSASRYPGIFNVGPVSQDHSTIEAQ